MKPSWTWKETAGDTDDVTVCIMSRKSEVILEVMVVLHFPDGTIFKPSPAATAHGSWTLVGFITLSPWVPSQALGRSFSECFQSVGLTQS